MLNTNYTKCTACTHLGPYCIRCDQPPTAPFAICQACTQGYELIGNNCVNIDRCEDPNCNSCDTAKECSACNIGYFLDSTTGNCSPCRASTQIDEGNNSCSCQVGYFLELNSNKAACAKC